MSERYSKLFTLPENLYATGSPVVIAAGALLKDNQTGKVLAQLKLRNIGKKTIKAATVSVEPLDTVGKPLGEPVTYQYLDLHADRDADFGQKAPVALPDSATRSFAVSVVQVIFTDNYIWNADGTDWESLNRPVPLDLLEDDELAKQFRIEYGGGCENLLLEQKDLWHCVCGGVNHQEEANCHKCRKALAELQAIDMEGLRVKKDERLAKERAEAEVARKEAEIARKKTAKIGVIAAAILAVVVIVAVLVTQVIIPSSKYNKAISYMDGGHYEEAIVAFEALEGYKDSIEKISDCHTAILEQKYYDAVAMMNAGEYDNAITAFEELDGYKDSSTQIENCNIAILDVKYNDAIALADAGQYEDAIAAFEEIDGYKDSSTKANLVYKKYKTEKLRTAKVGDYVIFGSYEQDNDTSNGAEEIEWLVLDRIERRILVISKYALECKPYNSYQASQVTWENCSLRNWLNCEFFVKSFSKTEQKMIPTVTVSADSEKAYRSDPGTPTQDKVFLLNRDEVRDYLSFELQCVPTAYAVSNGVKINNEGNCCWWLRLHDNWPYHSACYAECADSKGTIYYITDVDCTDRAVRPALWIDLGT